MGSFWQHLVGMWGEEHAQATAAMYGGGLGGVVCREVPHEYSDLAGRIVKFRIADMPLDEGRLRTLMKAFLDQGVRVPGTGYKISLDDTSTLRFGTSNGTEPELPLDWQEYLCGGASVSAGRHLTSKSPT